MFIFLMKFLDSNFPMDPIPCIKEKISASIRRARHNFDEIFDNNFLVEPAHKTAQLICYSLYQILRKCLRLLYSCSG